MAAEAAPAHTMPAHAATERASKATSFGRSGHGDRSGCQRAEGERRRDNRFAPPGSCHFK
jgi:hypothetical protein